MHAFTAPVCPLTLLAWRLGALPLTDLWWRYLALGGNRRPAALAGYLGGTADWPSSEHNVLAHVLNEALWDAGCPTLAPYRECGGRRAGESRAASPGPSRRAS